MDQFWSASQNDYRHTSTDSIPPPEPRSVPLSLQAQQLTLEESKTYMRWYSDILARTNSRTVSISDVYQFLSNFKIDSSIKEKTNRMFAKLLHLLNIGEFFALLRIISHALQGREPDRSLIAVQTSVPTPPSILSKKRLSEEESEPESTEAPQLDLDLFTQFILTGERPEQKKRLKKQKSVKFLDQIVTDIKTDAVYEHEQSDYLLMDQLMDRMKAKPELSSPDPEEKRVLKEMAPQINHFQNLNLVDTILVDGVPANIHVDNSSNNLPRLLPQPQLLKPNMTGPAQMALMGYEKQGNWNLLQPNVTGPADMARLLSPESSSEPSISLQSFSEQMTGNTLQNTYQNAAMGRVRSVSQPSPLQNMELLLFLNTHDDSLGWTNAPPVPPRQGKPAPPPPRRRTASSFSGPPLPEKIPNVQNYQTGNNRNAQNNIYQNAEGSSSTANILDDLKALQEEVDRIRDMSGGF